MREILFRAWDPLRNKMWKYAVPMFEGKINVSDCENGTFNEIIKGELMQWTGLFDCKGNKIYEGDVLKCFNQGEEKMGEVIFKEGGFWWEFEKKRYSFLDGVTKKFKGEVIGNRFQNPELINNTNQ